MKTALASVLSLAIVGTAASPTASANQTVYCHPTRSELSFGQQALRIVITGQKEPDCTLYGDRFATRIRYAEPEIEIHFKGQRSVLDQKCVRDFETNGGTARVSFDEAGASILIFGQSIKSKTKRGLQVFVIDGELICTGMPK